MILVDMCPFSKLVLGIAVVVVFYQIGVSYGTPVEFEENSQETASLLNITESNRTTKPPKSIGQSSNATKPINGSIKFQNGTNQSTSTTNMKKGNMTTKKPNSIKPMNGTTKLPNSSQQLANKKPINGSMNTKVPDSNQQLTAKNNSTNMTTKPTGSNQTTIKNDEKVNSTGDTSLPLDCDGDQATYNCLKETMVRFYNQSRYSGIGKTCNIEVEGHITNATLALRKKNIDMAQNHVKALQNLQIAYAETNDVNVTKTFICDRTRLHACNPDTLLCDCTNGALWIHSGLKVSTGHRYMPKQNATSNYCYVTSGACNASITDIVILLPDEEQRLINHYGHKDMDQDSTRKEKVIDDRGCLKNLCAKVSTTETECEKDPEEDVIYGQADPEVKKRRQVLARKVLV